MSQRWEHYYRGYREGTAINSQTQLPSQKGTDSAQEVPKTIKVRSTCVRCSPGEALAWSINKMDLIIKLSQQDSYSNSKSQGFDQNSGSYCHCCWGSPNEYLLLLFSSGAWLSLCQQRCWLNLDRALMLSIRIRLFHPGYGLWLCYVMTTAPVPFLCCSPTVYHPRQLAMEGRCRERMSQRARCRWLTWPRGHSTSQTF